MKPEKKGTFIVDLCFLVVTVFLLVLIILGFMTPEAKSCFVQTEFGPSYYSFFSVTLILSYFIMWGIVKTDQPSKGKMRLKELLKGYLQKGTRFIGLKRTSFSLLRSFCGLLIGVCTNLAIILVLLSLGYKTMHAPRIDCTTLFRTLLLAPLFEETIFRGMYLSVFIEVFGKNGISAALGIMFSSLIFGYSHPLIPIAKVLGGLVFGTIFLYQYRKDLPSSILAHFGANLISTPFVLP